MNSTTARAASRRLADLLRHEQSAMADFLLALAEFDRQRLWLDLGHSSLWYFLHQELGLSKGAAYHRKVAVALLQRHPAIEAPLRDGRLCLSSLVELAHALETRNLEEVLPRFFHLSSREAKLVAAELAPRQPVPVRTVLTGLPRAPVDVVQAHEPARTTEPGGAKPMPFPAPHSSANPCPSQNSNPNRAPSPTPTPSATSTARPTEYAPLTADRGRLHLTVSARLMQKLSAARDALSHARPGATEEEIIEVGLDLILSRQATRRGLTRKPRRPAIAKPSPAQDQVPATAPTEVTAANEPARRPRRRHVPAHVRRTVWMRDEGRCQWPLDTGGICGATHRVEVDHLIPGALGGEATAEGLRLLCAVHNAVAARAAFGEAWMDRFTARGRRTG